MKTFYFFFALFFLSINILLIAGGSGQHYYVSLSGSGNNLGSDWNNARAFSRMWSSTDGGITWATLGINDIVEIDGGNGSGITYTIPSTTAINCTSRTGPITIKGSSEQGHNGLVTIQGNSPSIWVDYNIDLASSKFVTLENLKLQTANRANINVTSTENCTIRSCSIYVNGVTNIQGYSDGVAGIEADKTKNLTIEYNIITTRDDNEYQLDCIKVGGLGTGAIMSGDETMTIRYNTIKNSSPCTSSSCHDDCIQFYTSYTSSTSYKFYNYGTDMYQLVKIYKNWIEQTASDDPTNTGILIGGFADYYPNWDNNYLQGKMTKWYIWSNVFVHNKGTGLLAFTHMDPTEIEVFNNTFYNRTNATGSAELFIYYNKWNVQGNAGNDLHSTLRNALIKNNIFCSTYNSNVIKFGQYSIINGIETYYRMVFDNNTVAIDNNCYWNGSSSNAVVRIYSPDFLSNSYTFSGWKNASVFDDNSTNSAPDFTDVSQSDFSIIRPNNEIHDQIIDQGELLYSDNIPETEIYGRTETYRGENGPWDIGAYETNLILWLPDSKLSGNIEAFPSPFNPSTTMTFSIPNDGNVSLTIYDIIGKEISVLVDDFKPAGKHTVTFNGENLSSGVYICLLKSGDYIGKKKIILLK